MYTLHVFIILINYREFKIQCTGTGVHPPLELTNQVIHFAATSLYDVSKASLHVVNSHTSMNEFTHPVPRIGKGIVLQDLTCQTNLNLGMTVTFTRSLQPPYMW